MPLTWLNIKYTLCDSSGPTAPLPHPPESGCHHVWIHDPFTSTYRWGAAFSPLPSPHLKPEIPTTVPQPVWEVSLLFFSLTGAAVPLCCIEAERKDWTSKHRTCRTRDHTYSPRVSHRRRGIVWLSMTMFLRILNRRCCFWSVITHFHVDLWLSCCVPHCAMRHDVSWTCQVILWQGGLYWNKKTWMRMFNDSHCLSCYTWTDAKAWSSCLWALSFFYTLLAFDLLFEFLGHCTFITKYISVLCLP